jgi:endothelin-converting enzyme/putative endopeptidase
MRNAALVLSCLVVLCVGKLAVAQVPAASQPPAAPVERPLMALPYTPGLDVDSMDKSADPCVDFYQYSCGGWIKRNPLPADQAQWDVYGKLYEENQRFLWGILDGLATRTEGRDASQQKIGDYFAACMDEAAIEKLGAQPLKPDLERIGGMNSKEELPALLSELHLRNSGGDLFFSFSSDQNFGDATQVIAFARAGGLGLPDRDYYLNEDEKSKEIRAQYLVHVQRMFELFGDKSADAKREAEEVMEIETALARASLTRVERRDPYKLFHKMDAKELQALTPSFDWHAYLEPMGMAKLDTFNVTQPVFFGELDRQLRTLSLGDIKTYMRWHLVKANSPYLSSAFVNADFEFFRKTLRGVQELQPRWKRCMTLVDQQLGEALGEEFVRVAFSPELKAKTLRMAQQIEQAMRQDIDRLPWMSAATREKAQAKLQTLANKIGYPDKWRDYGALDVKRGDFFGNVARGNVFESRRMLAKIGKPVDRGEWGMTPQTVNAYYDPQLNDINFPAGVLQPPLYDARMDDAPNYGNTGGTIGHELTHGFDDQGRKFDAQGNLKDWWTGSDAAEFDQRAQCIVDQYAQYTVVDEIKINSKLTLGEDIADLGGLILAWEAWKLQTAGTKQGPRDGFSPEQRFFVGYAQWACQIDRPENLRLRAITNEHSPAKYRVNGLVVNMPEFEAAFSCKAGQPMTSRNRCRIW